MDKQQVKVMAVDDDEINLEILTKSLKDAGYDYSAFLSSTEAWSFLSQNPNEIQVALLDKMMPEMDGIELLSKIKGTPELSHIPVIMQTGDVGVQESIDGLKAGAYYYLSKPFDPTMMIALVNSAVRDVVTKRMDGGESGDAARVLHYLKEGTFEVVTPQDAAAFVGAVAQLSNDPDKIGKALLELVLNAVEHGNLGIGYDVKAKLVAEGGFDQEVERRLALPENAAKRVEIRCQEKEDSFVLVIIDHGKGFKWQDYLDFEPIRLTDPNGRGIAVAKLMGLNFHYTGSGNQVVCSFTKSSTPIL
jgi:CheY-like chemotaxis protein/anti-sigma regulatory factor (Ser/Thr protein kinase)